MKIKILIGFFCLLFCRCQENSDLRDCPWYQIAKADFEDNNFSAYINHVGAYDSNWGLLCRHVEKYDIRVAVQLSFYDIEVFNYSDELIVNNCAVPNAFLSNIAQEISLLVIDWETVSDFRLKLSEKYNQWGYADIRDYNRCLFIDDVIVTPFAANFLQNRSVKDRGELIFVRFEQDDGCRYKDYLFYGDYNIAYQIEHQYDKIETKPMIYI